MRVAAVASIVVLAGVLCALQVLGSVAVRARAQRGAWVAFVPKPFARRVDELDTAFPLPNALRIVLARHALERGDLELAGRTLARLQPSADRFVLEGRLAAARHDPAAAVAAYLAAGDLADVHVAVDAEARRGDLRAALALERAVIARLGGDRTQADALAEAYMQLGVLQQDQAYRFPVGAPQRHANELLALAAYVRAAELAPLSLRYLLALGNQQLNLAQLGPAERSFARARDVDPTSAEPLVGFADAALRRNDVAGARAYLARARSLDPSSPAVRRMARKLAT